VAAAERDEITVTAIRQALRETPKERRSELTVEDVKISARSRSHNRKQTSEDVIDFNAERKKRKLPKRMPEDIFDLWTEAIHKVTRAMGMISEASRELKALGAYADEMSYEFRHMLAETVDMSTYRSKINPLFRDIENVRLKILKGERQNTRRSCIPKDGIPVDVRGKWYMS